MALSYCAITFFSQLQALTFYNFLVFSRWSERFHNYFHLFICVYSIIFLIYTVHLSDSLCVILTLARLIYDSKLRCEACELAEILFNFQLAIALAKPLTKPVPNSDFPNSHGNQKEATVYLYV